MNDSITMRYYLCINKKQKNKKAETSVTPYRIETSVFYEQLVQNWVHWPLQIRLFKTFLRKMLIRHENVSVAPKFLS